MKVYVVLRKYDLLDISLEDIEDIYKTWILAETNKPQDYKANGTSYKFEVVEYEVQDE